MKERDRSRQPVFHRREDEREMVRSFKSQDEIKSDET